MALAFDKKQALGLLCSFRQAERSLHYALSAPHQWAGLVAYYNDTRLARIADQLRVLREAGATADRLPSCRGLCQKSTFGVLRSLVQLLGNQLRTHWSFSDAEISFFSATLQGLSEILCSPRQPPLDELIALRADCYDSHYLIGRKLVGVPDVKKAMAIEHFLQSEHLTHTSFDEMGVAIST